MSFSGDVKRELEKHISEARHCQIAEIAAIINFCGSIDFHEFGGITLNIHTENESVARKYFTLLQKTFKINTDIAQKQSSCLHKNKVYSIEIEDSDSVNRLLKTIKWNQSDGIVDSLVIQRNCCKRAFIRGAFLAAGSISDPEKFYHLEIVCATQEKAQQLRESINSFELEAKIVKRKKNYIVYLKEGAQIVEMLGIMQASVSLMNLENVRILKEMRNSVNRQVNCEAANINKTVSAAVKQIEDIKYIRDHIGFSELSKGLEEIARLRLEYPQTPLKELGMMLSPQVGKSGVNHRLRKLSNLAEELRKNKEENYYD